MQPELRLYEDVLSNGAVASLPAAPRMVFVTHGALTAAGRRVQDGETFSGEDAVVLTAGPAGAALWRWDLVPAGSAIGDVQDGVATREKLIARLDTLPKGELLLRGDSVTFPPGGCAYRHRHQGPGIRCLLEGGIRIDTHGRSTCYGPGGAWYETGPDAVFAQGADRPTRFIRVMILPLAYLGKSSVEYLNDDDKAKPKSQTYKIFADMPLGAEALRP